MVHDNVHVNALINSHCKSTNNQTERMIPHIPVLYV